MIRFLLLGAFLSVVLTELHTDQSSMQPQVCKEQPMDFGDGIDNDCDGQFDEESCDGEDDDFDGRIDEDCQCCDPSLIIG